MSLELNEFSNKFQTQELALVGYGRWLISLRPEQMTLGAMVVSDTQGSENFEKLSFEDGKDLMMAFSCFERVARNFFHADKVNIICLMMVDAIVHFHLIPRYSHEIHRYDRIWRDECWPGAPAFGGPNSDFELLCLIRDEVKPVLRQAGSDF